MVTPYKRLVQRREPLPPAAILTHFLHTLLPAAPSGRDSRSLFSALLGFDSIDVGKFQSLTSPELFRHLSSWSGINS